MNAMNSEPDNDPFGILSIPYSPVHSDPFGKNGINALPPMVERVMNTSEDLSYQIRKFLLYRHKSMESIAEETGLTLDSIHLLKDKGSGFVVDAIKVCKALGISPVTLPGSLKRKRES